MFIEFLMWNGTRLIEMAETSQILLESLIRSYKSSRTIYVFSLAVVCSVLIVILSILFRNSTLSSFKLVEHREADTDYHEPILEIKPYVPQIQEKIIPRIPLNFLPETSEIEAFDDVIRIDIASNVYPQPKKVETGTEQEGLTALQMAIKMKNQQKFEKAQKLFQHAMALQPLHPDVLNHYGEFLEEEENDIIKADHLYTRALTVCPQHSRALVNRKRTLPVVHELDEQQLKRIDKKRDNLIKIPHNDPSLKRMKKEAYFQHIHHTVAIEGNTMTLAETRMVVETRMAVPGKSIIEHNEILGLEAALRYINNTLVNKEGYITVRDILNIHKRVLGNVDPIEAGCFRQTQVFVGEHRPPLASDIIDLMEEFVEWLRSEDVMSLHPVKQSALAHYKLVYIHPFVDGNGRTARLLMNLILMRAGYPPVIIRKQDRSLYYNYLQIANEGDVRPFVRFIAQSTEGTLDVYLYATEYGMSNVKALESTDHDYNDVIAI